MNKHGISALCLLVIVLAGGCAREPHAAARDDGRLHVVATTTIVGDIVRRVGGDDIHLRVLLPPDADPHGYFFRPADMAQASASDLVVINGAGLEGQVQRLLRGVTHSDRLLSLAEFTPTRCLDAGHAHEHGHEHGPDEIDPHFWTNPEHVAIWAEVIAEALAVIDPSNAEAFRSRAENLITELRELSQWIEERVARIPPERRVLVSDHLSFGYFADRYGLEQVGVIIRSFDSMAQPSARDIAELIRTLRTLDVPAIFVATSVNPNLAEQIARDTGTTLVSLYSGALSGPDGPAPDYFSYMRYNVEAITRHLAGEMPPPAVRP